MFKSYATPIFRKALEKINAPSDAEITFEIPKEEFGDLSVNIAMRLAKHFKKPPRDIAKDIIDNLDADEKYIKNIEIAGPGFINISFTDLFYTDKLKEIKQLGERFGEDDFGRGKKANLEYVSCNPTGLLHLGHGRNAAIGDTLANLLNKIGYEVVREYYFNNAGNQMNVLALSIFARYKQALGDEDYPFPENGYQGEYIKDIAKDLIEEAGDKHKNGDEKDLEAVRKFGEKWCFEKIIQTLKRMGVEQDVFFNESDLYDEGKVKEIVDFFKEKGIAYEKEGAIWLALSKLGLKEDRVIIKSTGEPTYRLPDIAYHKNKFERNFDLIIDVFGSDHIDTVPDVRAAVEALGYDIEKIKVVIHQFVTLTESGEKVKMSKRTGRNYTLDDLLDEVGSDIVRFFFLMRGVSTHLEFDLDLAKEQSEKNPVYYLQYAHARICSIFRKIAEKGIEFEPDVSFDALNHPSEIKLIKALLTYPETIKNAAEKYEPQILPEYLRELASKFHTFYRDCKIIGAEKTLFTARAELARTVKYVLKDGLSLLGVSAPEKM